MRDEESPIEIPRRELARLSRRELVKLSPLLLAGALAWPRARDWLLRAGLATSDAASDAAFRPAASAPLFTDAEVTPIEAFPYNSYLDDDPGVDLDAWRLTVEGAVERPGRYSLADIQTLPKARQNTRHVCIEGWSVVGAFGGARVSSFLALVGAHPEARFLELECADDYLTTIDIASARHPQSLLCYEMYGRPLDRGHGAPLRLQTPIKLGYKQAKYLTRLRVTRVLPVRRGTWEDRGYSSHGGL